MLILWQNFIFNFYGGIMFKNIGAKHILKSYCNFLTPYVADDFQGNIIGAGAECCHATRIYTPTENGQIVAGGFCDVSSKTFFNLGVASYFRFQNFLDAHFVYIGDENVFENSIKNADGKIPQDYYFKKLDPKKDKSVLIYNLYFGKAIVLYPVFYDGAEVYFEYIKNSGGITIGFITLKPGKSSERTRINSFFVVDESDAVNLDEAIDFYKNKSKCDEIDMADLSPFCEGALIDICHNDRK